MKIKSITNVITNSSDETYIFKSDFDPDLIIKELRDIAESERLTSSGMAGIIEAYSTTTKTGENKYLEESYKDFPEGYLVTTIDYGYVDRLYPYLISRLGVSRITEDEEDELWKPVELERYKGYSKLLLDTARLKPKEAYVIWTKWRSYRESTGSTDTGYLQSLEKVKRYLEERLSKEKDNYMKEIIRRSIEMVNKDIKNENSK